MFWEVCAKFHTLRFINNWEKPGGVSIGFSSGQKHFGGIMPPSPLPMSNMVKWYVEWDFSFTKNKFKAVSKPTMARFTIPVDSMSRLRSENIEMLIKHFYTHSCFLIVLLNLFLRSRQYVYISEEKTSRGSHICVNHISFHFGYPTCLCPSMFVFLLPLIL